jgi:hypothetical protein
MRVYIDGGKDGLDESGGGGTESIGWYVDEEGKRQSVEGRGGGEASRARE